MSSKEVFELRRQGRIDEALAMGRKDYAENPGDAWGVKALAWALHSAIKAADDGEGKNALMREFLSLPIGGDDEILSKTREFIQQMALPYSAELHAAREISKVGDLAGALAKLRGLEKAYPGQEAIQVALAWEQIKAIQHGLKPENPKVEDLWHFVHEYGRLEHVPRPSDLHSRMLQSAAKIARLGGNVKFCEFLNWWDPSANLREEDYQGNPKKEGGHFDGTVESVIVAVAKTISSCQNQEARKAACDFVAKHVDRYPEQAWFPYYHATCLLAVGRMEEAKVLMMTTVRAKMTEFWAWEKLGLCFSEGSDERLQCLGRAATCPASGPEFMVGVYEELARELLAKGHAGEARHVLERDREIRAQKNWGIKGELARLLESTKDVSPVDPGGLLKELATQADEVLLSDMPWHRGVVARINVEIKRDDGRVQYFHFVTIEPCESFSVAFDCRVSAKKVNRFLEKLPLGAPVRARIDFAGERPRVLALQPREGGEPWDVCARAAGIVERVNAAKGAVAVLLGDGRTGLLYFDSCPLAKSLRVGDFLECRWNEHNGKVRLLSAKSVGPQVSEWWKEFSGEYEPRGNGPGGHVKGIFVHERLGSGFYSTQRIVGMAVQRRNADGRKWWEAICLTKTGYNKG